MSVSNDGLLYCASGAISVSMSAKAMPEPKSEQNIDQAMERNLRANLLFDFLGCPWPMNPMIKYRCTYRSLVSQTLPLFIEYYFVE